MDQDLALVLRERALFALESSTTMLAVAQNLLQQGNRREAAHLRNEARYKRNESILLMDQARKVEQQSSNVLRFPDRKPAESSVERRSTLSRGELRNARTR
jgi:hypothetical protein